VIRASIERRKYEKTPAIKNFLANFTYSYTSIDAYLRCPLKFYFAYVLGLGEYVQAGDDFDARDLGIFLHEVLRETLVPGTKPSEIVSQKFKDKCIETLIKKFQDCQGLASRDDAFLMLEIMKNKVREFLSTNTNSIFSEITECEAVYKANMKISGASYKLKCKIDRVDVRLGVANMFEYILLDYKTGLVKGVAGPFRQKEFIHCFYGTDYHNITRTEIKKVTKSIQLPLYKYIYEQATGKHVIECRLSGVRSGDEYDIITEESLLRTNGFKEINYDRYLHFIRQLISEINNNEFFEFDRKDIKECSHCEFSGICL
jgi:hypothetical protein